MPERLLRFALLLLLVLPLAGPAGAATLDQAVPGGWWFSQTGRPGELGFALVDDDRARFWSEFRRLGGVDALGYPVSQRFELDGFRVQATQRVIMQWRPEENRVAFVNVFDRLHELGHDGWLQAVRQTPRHSPIDDAGKPWEQVVRDRLALMDRYPAIRAKYQAAVGDPVQANGLPTSTVVDVGNHFALRAQRVVFQQWKEKVPWAEAGEVTVALGGDIAKEVGLVPAEAARPVALAATAGPVGRPSPAAAVPVTTAPIGGDPARLAPQPGDFPGARVVDEAAVDAAALAVGRADPGAYAARLSEAGFGRGHRRVLLREAPERRSVLVGGEVSLFRDSGAAQAYWALDARDNWLAGEPSARLERVGQDGVGESAVHFRVVSGDAAARGYLVLFRRANAVAWVFALSQFASPTLEETLAVARAVDARLR